MKDDTKKWILFCILAALLLAAICIFLTGCYQPNTPTEMAVPKEKLTVAKHIVDNSYKDVNANPESTLSVKENVSELPTASKLLTETGKNIDQANVSYKKMATEVEESKKGLTAKLGLVLAGGIVVAAIGGAVLYLGSTTIGMALILGGGLAALLSMLLKAFFAIIGWVVVGLLILAAVAAIWKLKFIKKFIRQIIQGGEKVKLLIDKDKFGEVQDEVQDEDVKHAVKLIRNK